MLEVCKWEQLFKDPVTVSRLINRRGVWTSKEWNVYWEFPCGPVVRSPVLLIPRAWVRFLVGELRF